MIKKLVIQQVTLLWIGSLLGAGFAFVTQVIVARALGPTDLGIFSSLLATVTLLVPIASFGIPQFWLKVFGEEGWPASRWLFPSIRFLLISTSLVITFISIWGIVSQGGQLYCFLLLILSFHIVGQITIDLVSSKLQLGGKYFYLAIWQIIPHLIRLITVSVLAFLVIKIINLKILVLIYALTGIGVAIIGSVQIIQMLNRNFLLSGHSKPTNDENVIVTVSPSTRNLFAQTWAFALGGLFHLIYFQSDIILVRYIAGANDAGLYNVAFTVMAALYLLPTAIYQKFLLPKMHRWASFEKEKFLIVYKYGFVAMFFIGILAMLGVWVTSWWAIPLLFGEEYKQSIRLLNILAISAPILFLANNAGAVLSTQENMKKKVILMGFVAASNLLINYFLIPIWGPIGAAVSTVLCNFLLLVLYHFEAQKAIRRLLSLNHERISP